jgi:hypothetical protein
MKPPRPEICYLCGEPLAEPIAKDHVPADKIFPAGIRKRHNLSKLLTILVHRACNESYSLDEEYFIASLYPFAIGSYAGNEMHKDIRKKYRAGKKQKLIAMMMKEFDHNPSGLVLSSGKVIKRFDALRIERVLWKIVRGLNFHHHAKVWPEHWKLSWTVSTPEDPEPPEHFKYFMPIPGNEPHGEYQAVFSYRFHHIEESGVSFFYWALLLWDSILITLQFPEPP